MKKKILQTGIIVRHRTEVRGGDDNNDDKEVEITILKRL